MLTCSTPCVMDPGEVLVSTGAAAPTTAICAGFELTEVPEEDTKTVTVSAPATLMSLAKTVAVNCVVLTNTVWRLLPLIWTTVEPAT